jgi:hypothetical protein
MSRKRIVEIRRLYRELQAVSDDRLPALEFLESDVDTGRTEIGEGSLETSLVYERAQVSELAA